MAQSASSQWIQDLYAQWHSAWRANQARLAESSAVAAHSAPNLALASAQQRAWAGLSEAMDAMVTKCLAPRGAAVAPDAQVVRDMLCWGTQGEWILELCERAFGENGSDVPTGIAMPSGWPSIRDVIKAEIAAIRTERAALAVLGNGGQDEQALLALWQRLDATGGPLDAQRQAQHNQLLKLLLPLLRTKAIMLCRGDAELAEEVVSQVQLNWVEDGLLRGFDPQRGGIGGWIYGAARIAHWRLRHQRFGRQVRHQPLPSGTGVDGDLVDAFAQSVLGSPLRLDGLRRRVPEVLDDLRLAVQDKRHVVIDLKTGQSQSYGLKSVHLQMLQAALTGQFDPGANDDKHRDLHALTGKQKAQNAEDWRIAMAYVRQHRHAADLLASLAPSSTLRAFNHSHQDGGGPVSICAAAAEG